MKPKNSSTDKIKQLIEAQYKKDKEFFKEKYNRSNFKQASLKSLRMWDKKGKNLYSVVYKKFLKKKKIYNDDFTNTRFRRDLKNSEFKNVKITAKPSGITEEIKSSVEEIKDEIRHEHPQLASRDEQEIDSDLENFEQASHLIPVESISIFWDGVWQLMKLKWSMIAPLTPQERESLGKMWQPFFQNYASEKFIFLVIPTIMTFGILAPKVIKGRKLHKESEAKKKKEKTQEKKEGSK